MSPPQKKKKKIGYELTSCLPQLVCPQRKRPRTPTIVSMIDRRALKKSTPETMRTREKNGEITFGATSITGWKPDNPGWINQDNYCITNNCANGLKGNEIFMLFDGHGPFGHLVSSHCKDVFAKILGDTNFDAQHAFKRMQEDIEKSSIDDSCSGTTSIIAFIQDASLLRIAHVGDSRAVLVRTMGEGKLVPIALTNDHKPELPDETKRIKKMGGQVYSMLSGPPRVWYYNPDKSSMLGLAMSRSLGDSYAHKVGVSHKPQEINLELDESDEFIILASDGVWDVFDGNLLSSVTGYISNLKFKEEWDPTEAANLLVRAARKRWEKEYANIDDITCIIIKLKENCNIFSNV